MRYIIDIKDDEVHIMRLNGQAQLDLMNKIDESYNVVQKGIASIYLTAIMNGFQPPRDLRHLDKPID